MTPQIVRLGKSIYSGSGDGYPGIFMAFLVGDTIYFDAHDGITGQLWAIPQITPHGKWQTLTNQHLTNADDGHELWAHDTSTNRHQWLNRVRLVVKTTSSLAIPSTSVPTMEARYRIVGARFQSFHMASGTSEEPLLLRQNGSTSLELWAHDTSNHSTWQVADINSGSGSSNAGLFMHQVVGDTIYFNADDGSTGHELWAHDTSNIPMAPNQQRQHGGNHSNSNRSLWPISRMRTRSISEPLME